MDSSIGVHWWRYRVAYFYALRSVRKESTGPSNYDRVDVKSAQLGQQGMMVHQVEPLAEVGKKDPDEIITLIKGS